MNTTAVFCILFATLAVSYGWGMRGTVIGGEKGAMLPGLYLGLILAWFAGGGIRENYFIPAAAGLIGMTFGGTEPYGETIHMALCRESDKYRPVRGFTGLAFKGALWFALGGGFIAFSMSAMGGKYKASDILIFCLLMPVIQQVGYNIFNRPYDKKKNKFPAIYFSFGSREEWGSNLATVIAMLAMGTIKNDKLLVSILSAGFISGFIGWLIAIKFYIMAVYPLKNGKYIFGKLFEERRIDGWKIMEFTLGAIGALGIAVIFCLSGDEISEINSSIAQNGIFNPIAKAEPFMPVVILICAAAVVAVNIFELICDKNKKEYNSFLWDCIERPFFSVIPLIFVLLGSNYAARLMTVFMLIFVCAVKCIFDRFDKKSLTAPILVFSAVTILSFVLDIVLGGYSPLGIIIAGGLPYLAAELWFSTFERSKVKKISILKIFMSDSYPTVMIYMFIQIVLIYIISGFYFVN